MCGVHRVVIARHGHPEQTPVRLHELRGQLKRIETRRQRNPDNPTWPLLRERWAAVQAWAVEYSNTAEAGGVVNRYALDAARQVNQLGSTPADKVVDVSLSLYLLQEDQPHRFRSDLAFDRQLARRARRTSRIAAGSYWNDKLQRTSLVFKDSPPRTTDALAALLKEAFGPAGIALARLEHSEAQAVFDKERQFNNALESLT